MTCPRCFGETRPPGLWSDAWTCPAHGPVHPLHPPVVVTDDVLRRLGRDVGVPVWMPWPLPAGWVVSGLQTAGDAHSGTVASVLACSGPNPLPSGGGLERQADLLLVAEQPGTGLGAHLAGLPDVDPGRAVSGAPHLKLVADGHPTPLWAVEVDGLVAYVGEAAGVWLWALVWPQSAGAVLLETFELVDVRDPANLHDVPYGALSPRLHAA